MSPATPLSRKRATWLFTLLMLTVSLSGCFGSDDAKPAEAEDADEAAAAVVSEETGSITGKVVSTDIVELGGVSVILTQGDAEVAFTKTDLRGLYTINGLNASKYTITYSKVNHHDLSEQVTVVAGEITELNIQLQAFNAIERGEPFTVSDEIGGFMSCGLAWQGVAVDEDTGINQNSLALCSGTVLGNQIDPNERVFRNMPVTAGLQAVSVGLQWTPNGGVTGTDLLLTVDEKNCGSTASYRYGRAGGPPSLVVTVTDDQIENENYTFSSITEPKDIRLCVWAYIEDGANMVYQQQFTLYYTAFYNHMPNEGYNPIPDQ